MADGSLLIKLIPLMAVAGTAIVVLRHRRRKATPAPVPVPVPVPAVPSVAPAPSSPPLPLRGRDALLVFDREGCIRGANPAACQLLGYDKDELLTKTLGDIEAAVPDDELSATLGRLADGEIFRMEGCHRRKDGSTFPVELTVASATGIGASASITAICRDVTERQRQQRELQQAVDDLTQANARAQAAVVAKNQFLQTVSYRLRTPLNTVLGLSELMTASHSNPKTEEYLRDIHASGLELLNVIDEVSAVATAEAAMQADQQSYRTIIEMSSDGICTCRDDRMTFINAAGVRLLGGQSAAEFEGRPFIQFVHPDYAVLCSDNFSALLEEATATPMKLLHPSGKILDVSVSVAAIPDEPGAVLVIARNISELMRATRDVAAQVSRLNSILDTAVDAIVVCNEDGQIETFNHSAETMFGYTAQEALGQPLDILMAAADAADYRGYLEAYQQPLHSRALGVGREVTARHRDGTAFPAEISLSACHLDDRRLFTAMIRDVTERRKFEDSLAHSANHDSLTGLPNRRLLEEQMRMAVDTAAVEQSRLAVLFIDLDGFKVVNDVLGHVAGDELMIEAGRRLSDDLPDGDLVARFGGDEFTLVLTGISDRADVLQRVEAILADMSRPVFLRNREVMLTSNIGIALYPDDSSVPMDLILHASAAMIFAKAAGRNQYRFFEPAMHRQSAERLTLENELRHAIQRKELILHYQPQVEATTGRILGLEALVRWQHPARGLLPPALFIPLAEQTGLIVPLGQWVLEQACSDIRHLEELGYTEISVGVNISARQFGETDILGEIQRLISLYGIQPRHLDVEITESTLMNDPEYVVGYLEKIKALGVRLSIDDFGTGYSSLNYLKRFPLDTLKIDRSFIVDIAENRKEEAIAITIITLAHSLGMTALAEGVELQAQMTLLNRYGCDIIQGYLFSRPLPLEDIINRLRLAPILTPMEEAAAAQ
ncbi:MAG TPA: EAL domain-containing protein [Rhodospirillaceae bacterium]|nr:EAL domain-containing protein [Rhodospirillaceae bacterium]